MNKAHKWRWVVLTLVLFTGFVWFRNTSMFMRPNQAYKLIAHRGLAQTFDISKVEWNTNTAQIIDPPEHEYLENTIPSMRAAFAAGADVVELDLQITKDGQLAVFHDYDLSYRTNGHGAVKDITMDELRQLDVGYGYTADNGKSYPFRGKGIGLMPEMKEVLQAFPEKELLIHLRDANVKTAKVLWSYLKGMPDDRIAQITVYGNDEGVRYLRAQYPSMRVLSVPMLKTALLKYELLGWTGYVPKEMHKMEIHIPLNYAGLLWGWPHQFVKRMENVNTRVVIVDGNGKWSEGFDRKEQLVHIPEGYSGYVWTDRIDRIGH